MNQPLQRIVRLQKQGRAVGLPSYCSANRFALEAALLQARNDDTPALVEATSNQVDQFGGYSGMVPAQFARFVADIAAALDVPRRRIILGGDHLGPNRWRAEGSAAAMAKACDLVRDYVRAGFGKIHLDASMHCADDPGTAASPLPDEVVAQRAATLCAAGEQARAETPDRAAPVYVIGTEVPVPGGATETLESVTPTRVADAERTIAVARREFRRRNLQSAWERVVAVVVQPGVEFGENRIVPYDRDRARPLSHYLETCENLVYEAHSTDYQTRTALKQMVEDHFAILKVGPGLTFAFREAVFALAAMEEDWLVPQKSVTPSALRTVLEAAMLAHPEHWEKHHAGNAAAQRYARAFSYSDRSRYYWSVPEVAAAFRRLLQNMATRDIPLTLLSQYMPRQYQAVRAGCVAPAPAALIRARIMEVTEDYAAACRG